MYCRISGIAFRKYGHIFSSILGMHFHIFVIFWYVGITLGKYGHIFSSVLSVHSYILLLFWVYIFIFFIFGYVLSNFWYCFRYVWPYT